MSMLVTNCLPMKIIHPGQSYRNWCWTKSIDTWHPNGPHSWCCNYRSTCRSTHSNCITSWGFVL